MFKRSGAISFKTATIIVIGLHAIAALAFTQWSSFKAGLARTERNEKKQEIAERQHNSKNDWPTASIKQVACPKPKISLTATPTPTPTATTTEQPKLAVVPTPTPLSKTAQEFIATKTNELKNTFNSSKKEIEKATKIVQQTAKNVESKRPSSSKPVYTKEVTRTYNSDGTYEDETTEVIIQTRPNNNGYYIPIVSSNNQNVSKGITIVPVY